MLFIVGQSPCNIINKTLLGHRNISANGVDLLATGLLAADIRCHSVMTKARLTAKSADLETFIRFFPFSILFKVLLGWILFIVPQLCRDANGAKNSRWCALFREGGAAT